MRPHAAVDDRVTFPWSIDRAGECPCCRSRGLRVFYELRDVPAQSCLVLERRDEALEFPLADVRLGHCPACGFVTNTSFDAGAIEYSRRYEETQGFSPTFGAFARSLAGRLVDGLGLRGKRVMEIGCGKGEFLTLLCELGAAEGIGIDPAFVPQRHTGPGSDRVTVLNELFDESHARFEPDLICCRHTLEHVHDVHGFLSTLRRAIGDRNVDVFFEVPDASRVIAQPAFLDVYHEHCSYFSERSLRNAFTGAGFEVTQTRVEYAGQYLLLWARPSDDVADAMPDEGMERAVTSFALRCAPEIDRWRGIVTRRAKRGERVVVWGSGSKCVSFLTTLGVERDVAGVIDINPHRQGVYMPGIGARIEAPERLRDIAPDLVIVMNPVYLDEIGATLRSLGIETDVVAVD